jgi:hypothetical protein
MCSVWNAFWGKWFRLPAQTMGFDTVRKQYLVSGVLISTPGVSSGQFAQRIRMALLVPAT